MDDEPITFQRDRLSVSTDRRRLDLNAVLEMLRNTHWGGDLTPSILERAVANSLCFGLYEGPLQLGFARVVTDLVTYGYLTDVVIVEGRRGKGLGEWLVECVLAHPDLHRLRRLALLTRDAPDLYARFGFVEGSVELGYMELPGGGSATVRRRDSPSL
jgi:N-acetylglutamate synthase-like GNAT family acetyltransferase